MPGAYVKLNFTGTDLSVTLDTSTLAGEAAGDLPYVGWWVDGTHTRQLIDSSTTTLTIASGLANAAHDVRIILEASGDCFVNRWNPPHSILRITALNVHGTLSAPTLKTKRWLIFGDSITEGFNCLGSSSTSLDRDASHTWAQQFAAVHDAEAGTIGFGGQGWVSLCPDLTHFHDPGVTSQQSWRYLWSGVDRSFSGIDAVFINHGTNDFDKDPANVRASVDDFLRVFRPAYPTIQVYLIVPFGGSIRPILTDAVNDWNASHGGGHDVKLLDLGDAGAVDLTGTPGTYSYDGVHPNQAGHSRLATLLDAAYDTLSP